MHLKSNQFWLFLVARIGYFYLASKSRPQWTRNRMTPVRYQIYLQNMNDEQFNDYLEKEKVRYAKMQERAKEKAMERAKTLGV